MKRGQRKYPTHFGTIMIRWIECCGIALFAVLVGRSYAYLLKGYSWQSAGAALLAMPIGFYLADLLTGVIHWICDSFGNSQTPVWGPMLVGPFRRHHQNPLEITQISLAENLGASSIAGVIALIAAPVTQSDTTKLASLFANHLWLTVVVFAVISNLFHRWSHMPIHKKPAWLHLLQKLRLVLPSKEHLAHHAKPYRINYCILSGWANPLTNRIPWYRIEALLARLGIPTNFD